MILGNDGISGEEDKVNFKSMKGTCNSQEVLS